MTQEPIRPLVAPSQAQAELELLNFVLRESFSYPWNPAEPQAEDYFSAMEQEVVSAGWVTEEELAEQGNILSTHLEHIWSTVPLPSVTTELSGMAASSDLLRQAAAQVPQHIMNQIVEQARQVVRSNLSLADQLVRCVQECLPTWGEDDLQVLARPFAYAMRGSDTGMLEAALRSVRCAAWTELSGVEQARLSLAIARYAIAQMPSTGTNDR
jgi:hypothetical protein